MFLSCSRAEPPHLRFLDDFNIPTGTRFESLEPFELGGLSGLVFLPEERQFLALSDSRDDHRWHVLDFRVAGEERDIAPRGTVLLRSKDATAFEPRLLDTEGIARMPDGTILITSEGDLRENPNTVSRLLLFSSDGILLREIPVPEKILPSGVGEPLRGARDNLSLESLCLSPDADRLFTAVECALLQDGEPTSPENGSLSRIIEYEIEGNQISPQHEYVYELDPVSKPEDFSAGAGENGLVELLAFSRTELLALERSFFVEGSESPERRSHQKLRIYWISLKGASDVSRVASLRQIPRIQPVQKKSVLDLEEIVKELNPEFPDLDNFEGMCFGPKLDNGNKTLILVSDNNFQTRQRTVFLVFEIIE